MASNQNSKQQPWTIDGKPADQATVARINAASKRAEQQPTKKTRATAPITSNQGFSLMR